MQPPLARDPRPIRRLTFKVFMHSNISKLSTKAENKLKRVSHWSSFNLKSSIYA